MFDTIFSFIRSNLSEFSSVIPIITVILVVIFTLLFIAAVLYIIYFLIKKLPWLYAKLCWFINILSLVYLRYKDRFSPRKKIKILPILNSESNHFSSQGLSLPSIKNLFIKSKRPNVPLSICISTAVSDGEFVKNSINSLPKVSFDIDSEEHFNLTIDASILSHEFVLQLSRELTDISSTKPFDDMVLIFNHSTLHKTDVADLITKVELFYRVMGYSFPISVILNCDQEVGSNYIIATNINVEEQSSIAYELNYVDGKIDISKFKSWLKGVSKSVCGNISYGKPEDADVQYIGFLNYYLSLERDLLKLMNALSDSSCVIANNYPSMRFGSVGLNFPLNNNYSIPKNLIEKLSFFNYDKFNGDDNSYKTYKHKKTRRLRYLLVAVTVLFPLNTLYNISSIEGFSHALIKRIDEQRAPLFSGELDDSLLFAYISNIHFILNNKNSYIAIPKSWSFDLAHNIESFLLVSLRKEIYKRFSGISHKWLNIDAELSKFIISSDQSFDTSIEDLKNDEKLTKILNLLLNTSLHSQFTYSDLWFLLNNTNNKPKYIYESDVDWNRPVPHEVIKVFSDFPIEKINNSIISKRNALIEKLIQYKVKNIYENNKYGIAIAKVQDVFDKIQSLKPLASSDFNCIIDFVKLFNESLLSKEDKVLLGDEKSAQLFFSIYTGKLLSTDLLNIDQSISLSNEILQHHRSFQSELRNLTLPGIGSVFLPPGDESKYIQLSPAFKDFSRYWGGLFSQLKSINLSFGAFPVSDTNSIVPGFSRSISPLIVSKIDDVVELNSNFKSIVENSLLPFDPLIKNYLYKILTNTFRSHMVNFFNQHLDGLIGLSIIDDSLITSNSYKLNSAQINQLVRSAQVYNQLAESGVILSLSEKNEIGARYNIIFDSILESTRSDMLGSNPFNKLNNYVTSTVKNAYSQNYLSISDFSSSLNDNFSSGIFAVETYMQKVSPVLDLLSNSKSFAVKKSNAIFWKNIYDVFEQYRSSSGPIFDYESFVVSFLDYIKKSDCSINKKESIDASIILRASYRMIREDFSKLCDIAHKNEAIKLVNGFISDFQSKYIDRFPFSGSINSNSITKIEYTLLRSRFYEIQSSIDKVSSDLSFESKIFLNKLSYLFQQLDTTKPLDSFNFNISLNESILNEILSQLIEVQLTVGVRSYNLRNKNNVINWNLSDPVKLKLRLAVNSRYKPAGIDPYLSGILSIYDNSFIYNFSDLWSFYKFIHLFSSSESVTDSSVLRINLPLNLNGTDLTRSILINVTDNREKLPLPLFRGIKLSNISSSNASTQGSDNVITTNKQ